MVCRSRSAVAGRGRRRAGRECKVRVFRVVARRVGGEVRVADVLAEVRGALELQGLDDGGRELRGAAFGGGNVPLVVGAGVVVTRGVGFGADLTSYAMDAFGIGVTRVNVAPIAAPAS